MFLNKTFLLFGNVEFSVLCVSFGSSELLIKHFNLFNVAVHNTYLSMPCCYCWLYPCIPCCNVSTYRIMKGQLQQIFFFDTEIVRAKNGHHNRNSSMSLQFLQYLTLFTSFFLLFFTGSRNRVVVDVHWLIWNLLALNIVIIDLLHIS